MNSKPALNILLLFALGATLILAQGAIPNATLVDENGTIVSVLRFDPFNISTGSESYMDGSPVNPNLFLNYCHQNLTTGQRLDLMYYTQAQNQTASVLTFLPQVYNITQINVTNSSPLYCTIIDVDLASTGALYPGYLAVRPNNSETIYPLGNLSTFLNGSYEIRVSVDGPTHSLFVSVGAIFDETGHKINSSKNHLLLSLVDENNASFAEKRVFPGQSLHYESTFNGGDKVMVNGIVALEVKVINPCDTINESGYYIFNRSEFNYNRTCVTIENLTGVTVNFADEVVDGDANYSGSFSEDLDKACAVYIKNSQNITIEYLKSQQYRYGICAKDSVVSILGDTTISNIHGAYIFNNSKATFIDVIFQNNNTDIRTEGQSHASLLRVNFSSAKIKAEFTDIVMRAISDPPPDPTGYDEIYNISQWIQVYNTTPNRSWAQISFHYPEPLPNFVNTDNISIFKHNGTYLPINETVTIVNGSNSTNVSVFTGEYSWLYGNWTKLYTLISPSEHLIIGPNVSNFSVFAPFGFQLEPQPEPVPEPTPTPTPSPEVGSSGGGGGGASGDGGGASGGNIFPFDFNEVATNVNPRAIKLELSIPRNITLQQGEAGDIRFNISNIGDVTAPGVMIGPALFPGWDHTNYTVGDLVPGESSQASFQISPYEKAIPKSYRVAVSAYVQDIDGTMFPVTTNILDVIVVPRSRVNRVKILEFPPIIEIEPGQTINVSFLAENIGDLDLTNITVDFESSGNCVEDINGMQQIEKGETKQLSYLITAGKASECEYNIKFYSDDELVGFAPVKIKVASKSLLQSQKTGKKIALLSFFLFWTLLTAFVLNRRRRQ